MTYIFAAPAAARSAVSDTGSVMKSIEQAARKTGVSFDYLLDTAMRESSLNPHAQAKTSSATGLFQFIDQTWLGLMHRHGADHGYGELAGRISRTPDGRYEAADQETQEDILALRFDPDLSAAMAGEYAKESLNTLKSGLGGEPDEKALYAAHFMGASGAVDLIKAARETPGAAGADLFPRAAEANRSIFYEDSGRARSVGEVLARVTDQHSGANAASMNFAQSEPARMVTGHSQPQQGFVLSPMMILTLAAMDPLSGIDRQKGGFA